jgi:uncharacterized protein
MSERSEYALGEFCWVDLATTDVDGSLSFYGELLGVEGQPAPGDPEETGGYGFLTRDGKMVGGYGPTQSAEQPPAWHSYIKVEDADKTAEKAKEAGGQVDFGPIDLPNESGRMAVLRDPTGAFISINQQQNHPGAQLVNEIGTWTWNNLMTRDVDAAKDFYGEVFGWTATDMGPEYGGYRIFQHGEARVAGLMTLPDNSVPALWQPYVAVEDTDETTAKAKQLGGSALMEPMDVPNVGRIAVLRDPQGAVFGIIKPTPAS